MSELSVGFLSHSVHLLKLVENQPGISLEELSQLATKDDILLRENHSEIVDGLLLYNWIKDDMGVISVSESLPSPSHEDEIIFQRELLWLFIETCKPSWVKRMKGGIKGTKEAIRSANMTQVFRDLGLFRVIDELSDEAIEWWQRATSFSRGISEDLLVETGNRGERLTIKFELNRTGSKPIYMAIDSSSHGFDVKSQLSKDDQTPLMIEVKTSEWPYFSAHLHLTRNEYRVCLENPENYVFHLWDLSSEVARLLVVKPNEMSQNVPSDSGQGQWESVKIPFSTFDWHKSNISEDLHC